MPNKNAIRTIIPYKYEGFWVFDDESVGLDHEAFVGGADKICDELSKDFPNPHKGFVLQFSQFQFPDSEEMVWKRKEMDGNVYEWSARQMEGWLCPALFEYFETAPAKLYVKASPRPQE
jgi:hypothetical protein